MKNRPLSVQIWVMLALTTLGIFLILFLSLPFILRNFFTNETYDAIHNAQRLLLSRTNIEQQLLDERLPSGSREDQQNIRSVQHMLITDQGLIIPRGRLAPDITARIQEQVASQKTASRSYTGGSRNRQIHYIATKLQMGGRQATLVSYMWDTHQRELIRLLFTRLIVLLGIVIAISWLPALWLSAYVTSPLVKLQRHVKRMADRDWKETFDADRHDEIGQLSESIERMREQLVKHEELQQSLLQNISHELKTPVMVIHSYAQSIKDGVYPKGDLDGSVSVIEAEAERLDKRIRDLLYLTKLDYSSADKSKLASVQLDELIFDTVDRLRWRRPELEWKLDLRRVAVSGISSQLIVLFENILDNQIRYAQGGIRIAMRENNAADSMSGSVLVSICNDGPPLEEELGEQLFKPFHKGKKGEFGLGLSIVKRIVELHRGRVWVESCEHGVSFHVELPTAHRPPESSAEPIGKL